MYVDPLVSRQRKPRGQGASRRSEILEAAKRLFVTEGFEQTTIRRIAAAVGVSSAALYLYFPDKDAILRAIAESTFEALLARLELSQRGGAGPEERFRAGLLAYVEFGRAHPDEYRLTFLAKMMTASGPGRPARPCEGIEAADRSFGILQRGVEEMMAAGRIRPSDPALTAEALWACLHGLTALLLDQTEHLASGPDALIEAVLEIALRGLRPEAAA